jgi:hypothetical protein
MDNLKKTKRLEAQIENSGREQKYMLLGGTYHYILITG